MLARTHRDLGMRVSDPTEREVHLRLSYKFYYKGYQMNKGYYTGINAAAMALLLGDKGTACKLAREVRDLCLEELQRGASSSGDDYWILATLGEAALILGEWSKAKSWYTQAVEKSSGRFADLSSSRQRVRLLLKHFGKDEHSFDHCFHIPRVVVFAGHMIDQSNRSHPRFPPELEGAVKDMITKRLEELNEGIGYSSAACGSDILFLEAMLERGSEINVVLPFSEAEFCKASVNIIPEAKWGERFYKVLGKAARVYTVSEHSLPFNSVIYQYANLFMDGIAKLRAQSLDTELIALAVWDGRPGDGSWGTSSIVQHWQDHRRSLKIVDLDELISKKMGIEPHPIVPSSPNPLVTISHPSSTMEIVAILFADVVGYSKLTENEIPCFVQHFLGAIEKLIRKSSHAPKIKNTWGDALYFVFPDVKDAGNFALELRDLLCNTNWKDKGLPDNLNLRIALHAGGTYSSIDPVTQQHTYIGSHVSLAARIEPITQPGEIYASQQFAALAAAQDITDFTCDYIGRVQLAKQYGTFPLYHVQRK